MMVPPRQDAAQTILAHSSSGEDSNSDTDPEEEVGVIPPIDLEPDTYGMAVVSIVRDLYHIAHNSTPTVTTGPLDSPRTKREKLRAGVQKVKKLEHHRNIRLLTTLTLLFSVIFIQVFLLSKVKEYVTAAAVHDIRIMYDIFQRDMYTEFKPNTTNDYMRGKEGFMKPHIFFYDNITLDTQSAICAIPMSQPGFFFIILFIWTLTCISELRKCIALFMQLIWHLPGCKSMKEAMQEDDDDQTIDYLVIALPPGVKCALMVLVMIPRLLITLYLLWLGCRFLLATNDFAGLVLNAVALEFIICLKDSMFFALVPIRNKIDLEATHIKPKSESEMANLWSFVGTLSWGVVAVVFIALYVGIPNTTQGFQEVLPDYQWDVRALCESWIEWKYCVDEPCPPWPGSHSTNPEIHLSLAGGGAGGRGGKGR